tara:strand:- start:54 stop:554 length:501 start_codon:yes stop_codon:yes gene_type:complete
MKKLLFGLMILGLTTQSFAQVTLPEFEVRATNYKYLNSVSPEEVADTDVRNLEEKVASFDLKSAAFYEEDKDLYSVQFFIPNGRILAAYDKDGTLLRTIEKFEDVILPTHITEAILTKFPNWVPTKDHYLVNYRESSDAARRLYKIKLQNEDKTIKVKIDAEGNFI